MNRPRPAVGLVVALLASVVMAGAPTPATAAVPRLTTAAAPQLTNLAHLDWLGDRVSPPAQAGHSTYRLAEEPGVGVLWTYADSRGNGVYERTGGGEHKPDGTFGQGAFNSDDVSRAAIVYLRHWKQTGSATSRAKAYDLLRGLAYFQTESGPNAGNLILWMQPDGTLNPSAEPKESPDPSDSAESYWLARSIWAFGEGYAAFHGSTAPADAAFASFLRKRLDLSIAAVQRQTLSRYGQYLNIDGQRTPAWLIVNGADATAETVLGLAAYVDAGAPIGARVALQRLAQGIAALGEGDARQWPFGAVRPWALSRSVWHSWASQMPAALARASASLGDRSLAPAVTDSAVFDPWMLTSGGPDNGRQPTRTDGSQIAYGVDSRLQSLLATAEVSGSVGVRRLAGVVAAWYFGANASGKPAYDPTTGRTVDGISPTGVPNLNAGAESTIHGLLSMLALDANADVAREARTAVVGQRVGAQTVEVEKGTLAGGAHAVAPESLWTGEALYSGTGYAALGNGASVKVDVGNGGARLVLAVVDLQPGSTAVTTFRSGGKLLGRVRSGAIGAQGDSPAPGALLPVTLRVTLPQGPAVVTATTVASGGDEARLDVLMVEPLVSQLVNGGDGHGTAVVRSASTHTRSTSVVVPGVGAARVEVYNGRGRLLSAGTFRGSGAVPVRVVAGGFSIVRR